MFCCLHLHNSLLNVYQILQLPSIVIYSSDKTNNYETAK